MVSITFYERKCSKCGKDLDDPGCEGIVWTAGKWFCVDCDQRLGDVVSAFGNQEVNP